MLLTTSINVLLPAAQTNLRSNVTNCGACGTVCTLDAAQVNAQPACGGGKCGLECNDGWANCDGDDTNGCEYDAVSSDSMLQTCSRASRCCHLSVVDRVRAVVKRTGA
jgi:hypothetical protein